MSRPNHTQTLLLGLITTILVGWVLSIGAAIIQPIVIALLLAIMLQPVVVTLARFGIPPAATVVVITGGLFMGLVQLGLVLQSNVTSFISSASASGQENVGGWQNIEAKLIESLGKWDLPDPVKSYLETALVDMDMTGFAEGLLVSSVGFLRGLVLVLIYMVFIFAEQAIFRRKILSIAGDRRDEASEMLSTMGRGIQRYLGVKTVVSFLTASLCYAVLQSLEIPYALLFGLLTFLLNYIPTFGSIIAGLFPMLTALTLDGGVSKAIMVTITYLAVNLTLGSFIEPKILGRELNLSPLVVVISVVVWAGLWGIVGGFLAVPLTATMQIILASSDATRPIAVMLGGGPPRDRFRLQRLSKAKEGIEEED